MKQPSDSDLELFGLKGSPGIVMGKIVVVDNKTKWQRRHLDSADVPDEIMRFKIAVARTEHQLMDIYDQFTEHLADYSAIINSHILILKDGMIYDQTVQIIEDKQINAEWALDQALQAIEQRFAELDDLYIRERFVDVRQVGDRIFRMLAGKKNEPQFSGKVILAARDFSPEDTLRMNQDMILGFMTEMGGVTSHTAIVARTLGIPAVVGVDSLTDLVKTGDMAIVDGGLGRVFIHPGEDKLAFYRQYQARFEQVDEQISLFAHLPSQTIDGLDVQIRANIEAIEEYSQAVRCGAAGIGLFRSEFYYLGREEPPTENFLVELYADLLSVLAPFPVTIRTLDLGGDKRPGNWPVEENPALGLRSIRFSLWEGSLFKTQLRALFRAGVQGNLRILMPMISSLEELVRAKEIITLVKEELSAEGLPFEPDIQLGIMIEVPSAVEVADVLAGEVDFFSIGTNDLIQYAMAVDRINENVANMYEPLHPAILRMISQTVKCGHDKGIEVGLCGEMAGDITFLPLLLGLGIDELSTSPLIIPHLKRMIRNSTAAEVTELAARILSLNSANEIRNYLCGYLPRNYPEEFGIKFS